MQGKLRVLAKSELDWLDFVFFYTCTDLILCP